MDFNLEYLPNMIYITYKQKSSVKKILDSNLEYISKSGVVCSFIVNKNDFALNVRNIKDPSKTYENFLPFKQQQHQQVICNNYNPLFNNYPMNNKANCNSSMGMLSLLNNNVLGSIDPSLFSQSQAQYLQNQKQQQNQQQNFSNLGNNPKPLNNHGGNSLENNKLAPLNQMSPSRLNTNSASGGLNSSSFNYFQK